MLQWLPKGAETKVSDWPCVGVCFENINLRIRWKCRFAVEVVILAFFLVFYTFQRLISIGNETYDNSMVNSLLPTPYSLLPTYGRKFVIKNTNNVCGGVYLSIYRCLKWISADWRDKGLRFTIQRTPNSRVPPVKETSCIEWHPHEDRKLARSMLWLQPHPTVYCPIGSNSTYSTKHPNI